MKHRILGLFLPLFLAACGLPQQADDPAAEPQSAPNPASYTQAPGFVPLGSVALGQGITTRSSGPNHDLQTSIAVVADGGTVWHVEMQNSTYEGYVMGLVAEKQGGKVTKAVLGKPGEAGEAIQVAEGAPAAGAPTTDGVEEEVTIGIGSFASRKVLVGDVTSWTGTEGDLQGVLLKVDDPAQGPYELERMPENTEVDLGGVKVPVVKLHYSNGTVYWDSDHPQIVAFQPHGFGGKGRLKTALTQPVKNTTEIVEVRTDCKPQLVWR